MSGGLSYKLPEGYYPTFWPILEPPMRLFLSIMILLACTATMTAADVDDLVNKARAALKKGDVTAAFDASNKAVAADPKNVDAFFLRGEAYSRQRKYSEAIKDYDAALALDKTYLIAVDRRGSARFCLGMIDESIADFNTYLKAYPRQEPGHWRRGISFYYAGKYAEGAKQFDDGQVEFGADVENVFWHFLCKARKDGIKKAREQLLTLKGDDKRVPFMKINDMLHEKAKPADVIEAGEKADLKGDDATEAKFYANLYVALYFEAEGQADKCREHLTAAVEKYKIGHYMWDVANVHLARMKKK
jgi:lipoprotein NlpI